MNWISPVSVALAHFPCKEARTAHHTSSCSRSLVVRLDPAMMATALIPVSLPECVLEVCHQSDEGLLLASRSSAYEATCPECGAPSSHMHSYYDRQPRDLPISDQPVRLLDRLRGGIHARLRKRSAVMGERQQSPGPLGAWPTAYEMPRRVSWRTAVLTAIDAWSATSR